MGLYLFRGEFDQFLVYSANLTSALDAFSQTIKNIYGNTLRGWELNSDTTAIVHWLEEGETKPYKDHFQITSMPDNTAIWMSDKGIGQILQLPEQIKESSSNFAEEPRKLMKKAESYQ